MYVDDGGGPSDMVSPWSPSSSRKPRRRAMASKMPQTWGRPGGLPLQRFWKPWGRQECVSVRKRRGEDWVCGILGFLAGLACGEGWQRTFSAEGVQSVDQSTIPGRERRGGVTNACSLPAPAAPLEERLQGFRASPQPNPLRRKQTQSLLQSTGAGKLEGSMLGARPRNTS